MTNSATPPADDARLSDHEWRLKVAAEGKAIYVQGKSAEEWRADFERRAGKTTPTSLPMTKFEANTIGGLIEMLLGAVGKAENAFAFLELVHSDRDYTGHLGFEAVLGLCSDALGGVLEAENDQLTDFAAKLRQAGAMAEGAE